MAAGVMAGSVMQPKDVLDYWFSGRVQMLCFERDDAFDAEIRARFGDAVAEAQAGGFEDWRATPEGALALLILIDQMARNIYRGSPQAFAGDARALAIAQQMVNAGFDRGFTFVQRRFTTCPSSTAKTARCKSVRWLCSAPSRWSALRSTMSKRRCNCSTPPAMPRLSSVSAAIRTAMSASAGSRRPRKRLS